MKQKVVTFGEVMMRLSCDAHARFSQATRFDIRYAGSEATVASTLALWQIPSAHVTCLPDNAFGKAAAAGMRSFGVDTRHIVFAEGRLGLYFLEHGAALRAPGIIYDRFDSAFANLDPAAFNWDEILHDAQWFHWSGITPAISLNAAQTCRDAIKTARAKGITVSGDINYRRNLWRYGKTAREIMPALIEDTDIVVAAVTDFENCLGISGRTLEETCVEVVKRYPNIHSVTSTVRDTVHASHNKISGVLWNGSGVLDTRKFDINPIVDRVGAGDAFMSGFIYASLQGKTDQEIINFATASCALKHTVEGDVNEVSVGEIEGLIRGENVGKLLR